MTDIVTEIQIRVRKKIVQYIRSYVEAAEFSKETKNEMLKLAASIELQL